MTATCLINKFSDLPSTPCVFPLQVIDKMKVISFERGSCLLRVNDFAEPVLCFSSTVSGIRFRKASITVEDVVERALDGFWVWVIGHDFFLLV